MIKPEINSGSLVQFEEKADDPEVQKMLDDWSEFYKNKIPFKVCQRLFEHVSLFENEKSQKLLCLDCDGSSLISVNLLRLWQT